MRFDGKILGFNWSDVLIQEPWSTHTHIVWPSTRKHGVLPDNFSTVTFLGYLEAPGIYVPNSLPMCILYTYKKRFTLGIVLHYCTTKWSTSWVGRVGPFYNWNVNLFPEHGLKDLHNAHLRVSITIHNGGARVNDHIVQWNQWPFQVPTIYKSFF